MAERRQTEGNDQSKRLKQFVIDAVYKKTGTKLPSTQTLDQLVRAAAHQGITLYIYALGIKP